MAEQVTNYQCPACTGPLHFDGASGKLLCDYCGSSYSVEDMEALYAEKDETAVRRGLRRLGHLRPQPRLGRGGGRPARLQLPVVRGGASVRRIDGGVELSVLRQSVHHPRPAVRGAPAGRNHPVPAG